MLPPDGARDAFRFHLGRCEEDKRRRLQKDTIAGSEFPTRDRIFSPLITVFLIADHVNHSAGTSIPVSRTGEPNYKSRDTTNACPAKLIRPAWPGERWGGEGEGFGSCPERKQVRGLNPRGQSTVAGSWIRGWRLLTHQKNRLRVPTPGPGPPIVWKARKTRRRSFVFSFSRREACFIVRLKYNG